MEKGDLYRGLSLSEDEIEKIKSAKTINMQGLSSWSSDVSPAMQFAVGSSSGNTLIIDKTKGERNALSVASASSRPWEQEVIYGENQEFRVISVAQEDVPFYTSGTGNVYDFSKKTSGKVTVIEVESVR